MSEENQFISTKGIAIDTSLFVTGANNKPILELKANGDIYHKGKLLTTDHEIVNGFKAFLSDNCDNPLSQAEQQLLGFFHAAKGFSLKELLDSMALEKSEWQEMMASGMVGWMNGDQIEEINKYFDS